jgi:hypothetical protein
VIVRYSDRKAVERGGYKAVVAHKIDQLRQAFLAEYREAPHCAMPQPNFVPVMPRTSRNTQRRGVSLSTSTVRLTPLTVIVLAIAAPGLLNRNAKDCFRRWRIRIGFTCFAVIGHRDSVGPEAHLDSSRTLPPTDSHALSPYRARSAFLSNLPTLVLANASTNRIFCGTANFVISPFLLYERT